MLWNKKISFVYSWVDTIKIVGVVSFLICALMILLQPFDTYQTETDYKEIKLLGYSLSIIIPYTVLHLFERYFYVANGKKWSLLLEGIFLSIFIVFMSVFSFTYHNYIFSDAPLNFDILFQFFLTFILPFIPIAIPLIIYLRQKLGQEYTEVHSVKNYIIQGSNQEDNLVIKESEFLYAKANQNYVELFIVEKENGIEKKMIRSTLQSLSKQLPFAQQVHRSFLVNSVYISSISGNSRKRILRLESVDEEIPISNTFYEVLKQSHPSVF